MSERPFVIRVSDLPWDVLALRSLILELPVTIPYPGSYDPGMRNSRTGEMEEEE
jgi:hypothetical protein